MGTSKSSLGPGNATPLVPTWVDEPPLPVPPGAELPPDPPEHQPIVSADIPERFSEPRGNFTRFARTGSRPALGRALSGYVQNSSGGAGRASQRMAIPRRTASRILGLAQAVRDHCTAEGLRTLGLAELAGRPLQEVYPRLIDALCRTEDGGATDEAIARDALSEAVAEICDEGFAEGNEFTAEELNELFIRYVANTIFDRIFNDIAQSGVNLPENTEAVLAIESEVRDLIRASVRDSVAQANAPRQMTSRALRAHTDRIYQGAWDLVITRANEL